MTYPGGKKMKCGQVSTNSLDLHSDIFLKQVNKTNCACNGLKCNANACTSYLNWNIGPWGFVKPFPLYELVLCFFAICWYVFLALSFSYPLHFKKAISTSSLGALSPSFCQCFICISQNKGLFFFFLFVFVLFFCFFSFCFFLCLK